MAKRNSNRTTTKRSATAGISKKTKPSKNKATKHNDRLLAEGLDDILVREGLLPAKPHVEKAPEKQPEQKAQEPANVDALLEQICGL